MRVSLQAGLLVRQVSCQQSNHRNFVRRGLASFIAFMLIYGNSAMARSGPSLFFSCRSRRRRRVAGSSVAACCNALRGLTRLAFLAIWASRNRQILPAKGSIKHPNLSANYLANRVFLPLCRDADAISPCSQGGSGGRLRAQRVGEGPGLLAGRARLAAEVDGVGARGGAVESPLGDALHDRRQPEEAVNHVEFPVGGAASPGALAIGGNIFVL